MTKHIGLIAVVGCVVFASCSAPVPVEDAGQTGRTDGGSSNDSGAGDSGSTTDSGVADAGDQDAGTDAGVADAGCVGTAAAQLAFVSAPQMLNANMCSAALKVQLQTACGGPVSTAADLAVTFSATGATTEFFGDPGCIGKPSVFVIPGGANSLDIYFRDPASGMSTITATAAGVDGGSQTETIACGAGEKPCNGNSCIAIASCCTSADCVAPKTVCGAAGVCKVPPCPGIVNGCGSFIDLTASGANRTIAFSSSGYSPDCIRVSGSQTVTFAGDFFIHPVEQHCGPTELSLNGFGSTRTVTGFGFGTYGFHCKSHPAFENGAIKIP